MAASLKRFRDNLRIKGSNESIIVSGIAAAALLGGGVASLVEGVKARRELNRRDLTPDERAVNDRKSFLILVSIILLLPGMLSALALGRNLIHKFQKE